MKEREEQRGKVKQSLFPVSLFGIYIGVLFLMSGIHTGLIVFMNSAGWNKAVMTVVPMCYWGMVAMGLTLFTRWKVKRTYEEPLYKWQRLPEKWRTEIFPSMYLHFIQWRNGIIWMS